MPPTIDLVRIGPPVMPLPRLMSLVAAIGPPNVPKLKLFPLSVLVSCFCENLLTPPTYFAALIVSRFMICVKIASDF